ncbi:MAG TPA: methylthioribulose 1-phosphate dehydratase [Alphaproteobacteria bacterium]|nr:methylthioribulose 1-phosphate dehydratase [Alphaproteobacteria bacterium]
MTSVHLDSEAKAVQSIIDAGRFAAARGWVPATSGNFSARIDARRIAVTKSGRDKGSLAPGDITSLSLDQPLPSGISAEAPLHVSLYVKKPSIGAVFHVHSPNAALLSRLCMGRPFLRLQGWELQKAFAGVPSHEAAIEIPVFGNDQDTTALAARVESVLFEEILDTTRAPGYLLAGHGLYAWGETPADAGRHLEAFDGLFALELEMMRMKP